VIGLVKNYQMEYDKIRHRSHTDILAIMISYLFCTWLYARISLHAGKTLSEGRTGGKGGLERTVYIWSRDSPPRNRRRLHE
jgi:hypothetical protein